MTAPVQTRRPFMADSVIWERKGPLPVWGWAALVLLVALGVAWFRRGKVDKAATNAATGYKDELPGNQTAPSIFLLPVNSPTQAPTPHDMPKHRPRPVPPATVPPAPPAGGAPPPATPPQTPGTTIPDTLVAPAMTNLYAWSQSVEQQYGIGYPIIERARATGAMKWGGPMGADQYGNVPYFAAATSVKIR